SILHQHHHTPVNAQQQSVSPQSFISPSVTQQSQDEIPQLDSGLAVPTFQQGEAFLSVMASRFPPSNNQLKTSSNPKNQATIRYERFIVQQVQEDTLRVLLALETKELLQPQVETMQLNSAFQTEDLDAYDSDCDDISSTKAVLMENLSSCDSDVVSEESQDAGIQDTNYCTPNDLLVLSLVEQMTDHVANLDKENQTNKMVNESLTAELERYKEREHDVISMIDDEETLILEEESRSKMLDKQNDPILIKQKINISPIDYSKLNKITQDFGKRFVTKKELFTEQAFWLKHSNYNPDTSVMSHTPVRIEAPSEFPKVSLVNESLKKLKYQLASFDKVVKERTTSDAMMAAQSQQKDTIIGKLKDKIKSLSGKDSVENIKKDIDEIEMINIKLENKHCASLIAQINANSVENLDLNDQLHEKVFAIATLKNELRKLKGTNVVDTAVSKPSATIAPGMFKLDIEPILIDLRTIGMPMSTSLAKQGLVRGLPKLKYQKDHLCSACAIGKSKKHSYKPKAEDSIQEKLYLLHMDLCGTMRIQSINGRKYILVIIDDYSRTNNGTEFVNQTLRAYYEEVGISHQTSVARTPQQNGIVERRNRTLGTLFQPMFVGYFNPSPCVDPQVPAIIAPELVVSTTTSSSTTIDQDAPSTSTSQTTQETPSPVIPLGVKETDHDIEVAHMDNDHYFGLPILKLSSEESSSHVVTPNNVHSINQPPEHINKWTKDHSLNNIIGDLSRPKLVPRPDRIMIITLKWIFKVKLDELGGVLKNKARLVARGYHQEEGIDFEESFAPVA
ncbi:retrovirus-related pol polyprotein from transposon TNT 1-94, partial [Tanacetum coccineum]